jgi:hypothetical protein
VLHPSQLVFVTMATTNQLDDDNNKTKNKKWNEMYIKKTWL